MLTSQQSRDDSGNRGPSERINISGAEKGHESRVPRWNDGPVTALRVVQSDDARRTLHETGPFLRSDPVQHNLILTLLEERAAHPEPGHYGWVVDDSGVVGVCLQSPVELHATITPMSSAAVDPLVDQLAQSSPELPGVLGTAGAVSRFAGRWAETLRVPAVPVEAGRLYELGSLQPPNGVQGRLRRGTGTETDLILRWLQDFQRDSGGTVASADTIRRRLLSGLIWIWEHRQPVSMAAYTTSIAGVSRIGLVYTPPEHRRHGYAAACTAAVTQVALRAGAERCMLYTQLENPQSNAIYLRLGYQPVTEVIRFRFSPPTR